MPLPAGLSARQAMAIGTAGYTAMLCVQALERHGVSAGGGAVLVTGANGGICSVAIALLSRLGHRVVAFTGRMHESDFLLRLGAAQLISRGELSAAGKPLGKQRWAAVIDAVGSHTLANACANTRYGGAVAACGLAQGMDLPASVAPFILRAVTLYGLDSRMAPMPARPAACARLARDLNLNKVDAITQEIGLGQAVQAGDDILAGRVRGRLVVNAGGQAGPDLPEPTSPKDWHRRRAPPAHKKSPRHAGFA